MRYCTTAEAMVLLTALWWIMAPVLVVSGIHPSKSLLPRTCDAKDPLEGAKERSKDPITISYNEETHIYLHYQPNNDSAVLESRHQQLHFHFRRR
jgi:hypothetical protein